MKVKYSWQQVLLHWLSAVVIIWATVSGFYIGLFAASPSCKALIGFINVSLTTIFIPFFLIRVFYFFKHGKPLNDKRKSFSSCLANFVHVILYINITLVLVTGVLMMESDINVFNIFKIPQPFHQIALTSVFNKCHVFSCTTLALLVILHISAVIKHHLYGNKILRRMSF